MVRTVPALGLAFVLALLAGCSATTSSSPTVRMSIAPQASQPTGVPADPTREPSVSPSSAASAGPPATVGEPGDRPEGQLAYVAGNDPQIFLLDLATGESRQLTNLRPEDAELTSAGPWRPMITCSFGPSGLAWSPDGSLLAFSYGACEGVVHVVDMAGNLRRIADGNAPDWSPDGRLLAYSPNIPYAPCGRGCIEPPYPGAYDVHVVDIAGGDPRPLTVDGAAFAGGQPHFSPDGTLIAHTGPIPDELADPELFSATHVTSADGSGSRLVRVGSWPMAWLPDGRIAVIDELTSEMTIIDVASGAAMPVLPGRQVASISPDGALVAEWTSDPVSGASGTRLRTLAGLLIADVPGMFAAWSPDSRFMVGTGWDVAAFVVVAADGTLAANLPVDGPIFPSVAWRPGS